MSNLSEDTYRIIWDKNPFHFNWLFRYSVNAKNANIKTTFLESTPLCIKDCDLIPKSSRKKLICIIAFSCPFLKRFGITKAYSLGNISINMRLVGELITSFIMVLPITKNAVCTESA